MAGLHIFEVEEAGTYALAAFVLAFFVASISTEVMWTYALAGPPTARHAPHLLIGATAPPAIPILISMFLGQRGWLLAGISTPENPGCRSLGPMAPDHERPSGDRPWPLANSQIARLIYNSIFGAGPLVIRLVVCRAKASVTP
jgi:hypothetical protein